MKYTSEENPMKLQLALAASVFVVAACSSTPPAEQAAAPEGVAKPTNVVYPEGPAKTGTRFANRSTDRSVRMVGNQDAKDDAREIRSLGNSVGARSN
jgi:hypothetical protein